MTSPHPVLFVSHGAPDLLLDTGPTGALWSALGAALPRPSAILAVSAHWEAPAPVLTQVANPATIHDFGGFRRTAPQGAAAHPTEEHLLPLFVALGAADPGERPARLAPGFTYGGLAMDAYLWPAAAGGGLASRVPRPGA